MPAETASPVPPRLIVSTPAEEAATSASDLAAAVANSPSITTILASRKRSKTESSALKASGVRQPAAEWVDVDDTSRQRKSTSKSSHRSSVSSSSRSRNRRNTEGEVGAGGFFPKLGRMLEGTSESRSTSRPASLNDQSKRTNAPTKRHRHRDDPSATHRRPAKHRVGGVSSRRPESGFQFNPSLLSVLSSMTGTSDQSTSSSNTTITQASYDRKNGVGLEAAKIATNRDRRLSESEAESKSNKSEPPPEPQLNVFDFMESSPPNPDDGHDGRSVYSNSSSGSSRYELSDAGSSELPGTPSSHSTLPSPSSTRNSSLSGSVAELRRKYDAQIPSAPTSQSQLLARSGSLSPELGMSGVKKVARVRTVAEEEQDAHSAERRTNPDVGQHERFGPSPNGSRSRPANRSDERLRFQEDTIRHQQGQHYVDPTAYPQHRSRSASSHGSVGFGRAYAPYTAMQQYQYPSPPTAPPRAPFPPTPSHPSAAPPPAPEPPDFSQTTLVGYEKLALALSSPSTTDGITPCYRRFSYLQHRILLHLQDELSELEEQLRVLDEICAQQSQHHQTPSSRRADFYHGSEIHHRRTALLGRVFLKMEQYQKAMKGFSDSGVMSRKARENEVGTYREFLGGMGEQGIWEGERRFLEKGDLVVPGQREESKGKNTDKSLQTDLGSEMMRKFAPVLILALLGFAIIPSLWGRLVVLMILAVGAFVAAGAAVPSIQELLPTRELRVVGGVVVLVAVVAGMAF